MVTVGLLGGYAVYKQMILTDLEREYAQFKPDEQRRKADAERWRAMRQWFPKAEEGNRLACRKIFDAICNLFPPNEQAYVKTMTLARGGDRDGITVKLTGQVSAADLIFAFTGRLNESALFENAEAGPVADVVGDPAFPKQFSVTFSLRDDH